MTIRPATSEDLHSVTTLLESCDLPAEDVGDHLQHFFVAMDGNVMAGVVGLEVRQSGGLLRSLAVDPGYRGTGLGIRLTNEIMSYAAARSISEVGLLTTTAEGFFARRGFQVVHKDRIPAYVAESNEYKLYCPASAVCMVKHVP